MPSVSRLIGIGLIAASLGLVLWIWLAWWDTLSGRIFGLTFGAVLVLVGLVMGLWLALAPIDD